MGSNRCAWWRSPGYGQPSDRALALEAGFDEHIPKPAVLEKVLAAIAA